MRGVMRCSLNGPKVLRAPKPRKRSCRAPKSTRASRGSSPGLAAAAAEAGPWHDLHHMNSHRSSGSFERLCYTLNVIVWRLVFRALKGHNETSHRGDPCKRGGPCSGL